MKTRGEQLFDLKDCSEFRQTLLARTPQMPQITGLFLAICLLITIAWAGFSKAHLVVRAGGRMRPLTVPTQVFSTASGEITGSTLGGRITKVNARAGDVVRRGDMLLEIDAQRIDAEIERQTEIVAAGEEEAKRLTNMLDLMKVQFDALRQKQQAEIDRAQEQIDLETSRRQSEIRLAEAELESASEELIIAKKVATKLDLLKASLAVEQIREKLAQASIPVERGHLKVFERAFELTERDHEVKKQELAISLAGKQGEVATAKKQLEKLSIERRNTVLVAPIDGVVTHGKYEVGGVVPAGEPAFEIASQDGLLFEAAVTSEDIGLISVGMPVRLKLDAFYYQKYGTLPGKVVYVSPDSATDEKAEKPKVAYLVKIAFDDPAFGRGEALAEAKLGMTGSAEIVTGQESILFLFFKTVRQSISLD